MPTHTMRAVRIHEHGGPEVLRYDEVPITGPGPGEVLVRVHAVGINPPDWYLRDGLTNMPPETRPKFDLPVIPGTDVSGVVEAVATDVEGFSVGDEVFGLLRFPGFEGSAYAEYVAAPASDLAHKPAGIDHVHAAGAPMALLTAWQFLIELGHDHPSPFQAARHRPVALDAGTTVLVNGAAGGVGHFAVQLAKWKGAHVIAVASGAHESFLRELGADESSTTPRFAPRNSCATSILSSTPSVAATANASCAHSSAAAPCSPCSSANTTTKRPRSWASRSRALRSARMARSLPNWDVCSTQARCSRDRQHVSAGGCPGGARTRRPRAYPRQDRAHGRVGTTRVIDACGARPGTLVAAQTPTRRPWGAPPSKVTARPAAATGTVTTISDGLCASSAPSPYALATRTIRAAARRRRP